jgi:arsenate reductase
MSAKENVLILCTGNSCRSQMAEGLLRELAGDRFQVLSAGMEPAPEVHPLAVRVMAEIGIDISKQRPKNLSEYLGRTRLRWLIIVCDKASRSCPRVWPMLSEQARLDWPFDDPAEAAGSEEEKLAVFRRVRDEIKAKLEAWLAPPE